MGTVKKITLKIILTFYFYSNIIGLKKSGATLLKNDNKSCRNIDIYNIGYITIKKFDDCESIYSVNPLYFHVDHGNKYIEEKGGNKYLIFDSTDENKESLKKYKGYWNGIRNKIKEVSNDEFDYEKEYMKTRFSSDDDLPSNKPLKFRKMNIIIRSIFREDGKSYAQVFLDDTLYKLNI